MGSRYVHVAAPLLFMLCLAAINLRRPGVYRWLVIEDGLVEWATVVVYVIAALLGIRLCRRLSARRSYAWVVYYAVMSLAFVFIAGEEISWGQRIFGVATPEYFRQRNVQSEIGFHNMSTIRLLLSPAYITIGLGGAFGGLVLSRLGVPRRVVARLLPAPRLLLYFLPCSVFYFVAEIISPYTTVRYVGTLGARYGWKLNDPKGVLALPAHILDLIRDCVPMWSGLGGQKSALWHHQEPVELLLALGFLFFVVACGHLEVDHERNHLTPANDERQGARRDRRVERRSRIRRSVSA